MLKRLKEKSNDEKIKHTMNKRISFVFGAIVVIFGIIVLRLDIYKLRKAPIQPTSKNDENITVNESVPREEFLIGMEKY